MGRLGYCFLIHIRFCSNPINLTRCISDLRSLTEMTARCLDARFESEEEAKEYYNAGHDLGKQ